jgi:site-specific recombinase XerD
MTTARSAQIALDTAERLLPVDSVLTGLAAQDRGSLAGLAGTALLHARLAAVDDRFTQGALVHWKQAAAHARRSPGGRRPAGIFYGPGALATSLILGSPYLPDPEEQHESTARATQWLSARACFVAEQQRDRLRSGALTTPWTVYDTINGLAGIGRVLLASVVLGHIGAQEGLIAALNTLTAMIGEPGQRRPGWWLSADQHPPVTSVDVSGAAATGLAHGIAGPLALLAVAHSCGYSVAGQPEAIRHAARWLLRWQEPGPAHTWPPHLTGDELDSGVAVPQPGRRDAWCYKLTELDHEFSQFRGVLAIPLLASHLMIGGSDQRDLARVVVLDLGRLAVTGNEWEPFHLLDADGAVVEPVVVFFAGLQAEDKSVSTLRAYGNDLLLWWRWLAAVGVAWNQATTIEGRDFLRWMRIADKPARVHWRYRHGALSPASAENPGTVKRSASAGVNPVTGKAGPGLKYAPASRARAESTLRTFYDVHLETGQGPIVNPFPLDRSRRGGRANAHHNPMDQFKRERKGRYRPRVSKRIPKRIPDEQFNAIFAGLKYHRDRALLAFWVSTGARAEELLDSFQGDVYPGDQLISVTRKGSRDIQQIPASPDSFVWLRLYQEEIWKRGALRGRDQPLWFTLRRPFRPLTYAAARAMFQRANELLGSNWGIHDLRHTAAWRMAQDPEMSITDVQWILAHASLETTQLYTTPDQHEVIVNTRAYHQRRAGKPAQTPAPPAPGYNPESLRTLFGGLS